MALKESARFARRAGHAPLAGRIEVGQGFRVGRVRLLPEQTVEGQVLKPEELPEVIALGRPLLGLRRRHLAARARRLVG